MPQFPPAAAGSRAGRRLAALLLAGAVLAVGAGACIRFVWTRLPRPQLARLDWKAVRQARADFRGPARAGLIAVISSNEFTAAWQRRRDPDAALESVRQHVAGLSQTQLGRLQLCALAMLRLERQGVPLGQWWPRVRMYLEGLDQAPLGHCLIELLDAEMAAYRALGLPPGTARQAPLISLSTAHGPFLQYFVQRTRQLVQERSAAGDAAAAHTCRRLVRRLLREWVLSSGPAGLRLLAAELLGDELDPPDGGTDGTSDKSLARKLRAWRMTYRQNASACRPPPGPLRVAEELTRAGDARRLTRALAWMVWSGSALAGVAILAGVSSAVRLAHGRVGEPPPRFHLAAAWPTGVILLIGWTLTGWAPDLVWADFHRLQTNGLGWPRLPLLAFAAGLGLAGAGAACGLKRRAWWGWMTRLAVVAAVNWAWLAAAAMVSGVYAELCRRDYERTLSNPLNEHLVAVADPNANGLLDDLRAWNP